MNYMERMRPKGYDKRVWEYCFKNAEADKQWAIDTVTNNQNWCKEASKASLEMLGSYLYLSVPALAKQEYDYLQMRSHGETFLGALDPSARATWEFISAKRVNPNKTWKYDHTKHITSAKLVNGKWVDYSNKEIDKGRL